MVWYCISRKLKIRPPLSKHKNSTMQLECSEWTNLEWNQYVMWNNIPYFNLRQPARYPHMYFSSDHFGCNLQPLLWYLLPKQHLLASLLLNMVSIDHLSFGGICQLYLIYRRTKKIIIYEFDKTKLPVNFDAWYWALLKTTIMKL